MMKCGTKSIVFVLRCKRHWLFFVIFQLNRIRFWKWFGDERTIGQRTDDCDNATVKFQSDTIILTQLRDFMRSVVRHIITVRAAARYGCIRSISLIPPLHRGCDLCASLVRPQNCPGRRWRQKGGRTVALVVQGWHTGRSGIAMDAMVAVKFWACSKQSHKGRRGGRSLTGRSKEAGWRHTHRRGRRMDAQWSAIGRPVKNANIVFQFERHVCLPCTTIVPPLDDQWRPLSDHCGDHCASIQRPRQHLSHHGDGSAFTLPSLRDLLCHYNSFGRSRKAQGSCCSSYTETELSGFRRPLSVLTIFVVAQGWHEGRSPV